MRARKESASKGGGHETPSQLSGYVEVRGEHLQTVGASSEIKVETNGDDFLNEIVVQCPAASSPRSRSTGAIQRASTLPSQQTPDSSSRMVQRSKTAPNLDPRPVPCTPKKTVRIPRRRSTNAGRSRAMSISTDGCATEEEIIPPSPATDVSNTLSPTFGRNILPFSPHHGEPSQSPPARRGGRDDGDSRNHQTLTTRSARGGESHTSNTSPTKRSNAYVRSTTQRGAGRSRQSLESVDWDSPPLANEPPIQGSHRNTTPRTPRGPSRSRPHHSSSGSSQLTYASDDERPGGSSGRLNRHSDYHTPPSRSSDMSDDGSEPRNRVPSSRLKRKGKHRASPPPPSSLPRSSSPSSHVGSSPQKPNAAFSSRRKKRRDKYSRPPSPGSSVSISREEARRRATAGDLGQSTFQDVCCCAGPCPSCHKPRPPFPPQYYPSMFHPVPYPPYYFPPPHIQAGYPPSHYGPFPYPYPHAIPQQMDLLPSISSAQPIPPPSGYPTYHPSVAHPHSAHQPDVSAHTSPPPAPNPSTPAPNPSTPAHEPSTSALAPESSSPAPAREPSVHAGSSPVNPPATGQVPPEFYQRALDQFSPLPQYPLTIIGPSCDPRSPYSKTTAGPAFPNR